MLGDNKQKSRSATRRPPDVKKTGLQIEDLVAMTLLYIPTPAIFIARYKVRSLTSFQVLG